MPSGYTAALPTDTLLDTGLLFVDGNPWGASVGGVRVENSPARRNVVFDGKRSDIAGLDRLLRVETKVTGNFLPFGTKQLAYLHENVGDATTTSWKPGKASTLKTLPKLLPNVTVAFQRASGGYILLRFPFAVVGYTVEGNADAEGIVGLTLTARVDTPDPDALPYRIERMATLPLPTDNVIASILVTFAASPAPGGTAQATASARNAAGLPVSPQPALTDYAWAIVTAGAGTVSASGLFTADPAGAPGVKVVSATLSGVTGNGNVTVLSADDSLVTAFNAGTSAEFEPATISNSDRFRVGLNMTIVNAPSTFTAGTKRCTRWGSIDNTKAVQIALGVYQGLDTGVGRNGALLVYALQAKLGVPGVTEVLTAELTNAATNEVTWTGSVGGLYGVTTNQAAPPGAPFTANAANVGGGIGWVTGAKHVFNLVSDRSFEVTAAGLLTGDSHIGRITGPVGCGTIPAGGRYYYAIPQLNGGNGFVTVLSRAHVPDPAEGGAFPPETLALSMFGYGDRTSASVAGALQASTPGLNNLTTAGGTCAGFALMHIAGDRSYVNAHYDRPARGHNRHDPVTGGNVPSPNLSAGDQPVYIAAGGYAAQWSATAAQLYEWGFGTGDPVAVQIGALNDFMRAHPAFYGGTVAPEFTGHMMLVFHHSVWEQLNGTRMVTKLAPVLYVTYAAGGMKTNECGDYFLRPLLRGIDGSKLTTSPVYVGEGVNDVPDYTATAQSIAETYWNNLTVRAKAYRATTAVHMPIILASIMRPGIYYNEVPGSADYQKVQAADFWMRDHAVAQGAADGVLDQTTNVLTNAQHNGGDGISYWSDPHLYEPAGNQVLEDFIAADVHARTGV